jgi:hypothetical protein
VSSEPWKRGLFCSSLDSATPELQVQGDVAGLEREHVHTHRGGRRVTLAGTIIHRHPFSLSLSHVFQASSKKAASSFHPSLEPLMSTSKLFKRFSYFGDVKLANLSKGSELIITGKELRHLKASRCALFHLCRPFRFSDHSMRTHLSRHPNRKLF